MLNPKYFFKIIPIIFIPIIVQADENSDFWCDSIFQISNCTVIKIDDTEAEKIAKLDKALSEGFDDIGDGSIEAEDENTVVETEDDPIILETEDDPVISKIEDDPIISEIEDNPVISETKDDHIISETEDNPIISKIEDNPVISETKDDHIISETEDDPIISETEDNPIISEIEDNPIISEIEDNPIISEIEDNPIITKTKDNSIDTNEVITPVTNILPIYNSSPTKPCPESNKIYTYCTFQNREIDNIFIAKNASVSNGILTGQMENHGWASNLTIEIEAIVTGLNSDNDEIEGVLTGTITNNGTIENIAFHGASISGGNLGGIIFNNSKIDGICDVNLLSNTLIIGGTLCGEITGNPEYPAMLETLTIKKGSYLKNLIISNDVIFEDRVTIGENVIFLP